MNTDFNILFVSLLYTTTYTIYEVDDDHCLLYSFCTVIEHAMRRCISNPYSHICTVISLCYNSIYVTVMKTK